MFDVQEDTWRGTIEEETIVRLLVLNILSIKKNKKVICCWKRNSLLRKKRTLLLTHVCHRFLSCFIFLPLFSLQAHYIMDPETDARQFNCSHEKMICFPPQLILHSFSPWTWFPRGNSFEVRDPRLSCRFHICSLTCSIIVFPFMYFSISFFLTSLCFVWRVRHLRVLASVTKEEAEIQEDVSIEYPCISCTK